METALVGDRTHSWRYKCICVLSVAIIACLLLIWNTLFVSVRDPTDDKSSYLIKSSHLDKNNTDEKRKARQRNPVLGEWEHCKLLIKGKLQVSENGKRESSRTSNEIFDKYLYKSCYQVKNKDFGHPVPSSMEKKFPIAYGIIVYKGLPLLERILQAIYMPQNVYCIHVDKKSPRDFHRAVKKIISCLPNVFIASELVNVRWGEISVLEAQLSCLKDLYKHRIQWKYYLHLVGQDFPLYSNYEIVRALQTLNGTNNIESFPMARKFKERIRYVYKGLKRTKLRKSPPPVNITTRKGAVHGIFTRKFVQFLLESPIANEFFNWCKDIGIPDETYFASLQNYPRTPGGIQGPQPAFITKYIRWGWATHCHGRIVRQICWISVRDLEWVLDQFHRSYLFIHKIPFNYDTELLDCLSQAIKMRRYPSEM